MIYLQSLLIFSFVLSSVGATENRCTPYTTCGECIVSEGGECSFCEDDDFDITKKRCNFRNELIKSGCKSINKEKTTQTVLKNEEVTDTVQVQPQEVNLKLRVGQPAKFNLKVRSALDYPVDLYYLMDLSNSMKDDLKNLTKLALDIADVIGDITKNYRLGFGSFVDKPVAPFIQIDTKDRPCATCVPTFGFKHNFR